MMTRRTILALAAAAASAGRAAAQDDTREGGPVLVEEETGTPFDAAMVQDLARQMSGRDYKPEPEIPAAWREMDYDTYRSIWFRHDRALWTGTDRPYRIDLFHPGLYYPRAVRIDLVADGVARPVPFRLSDFDMTDQVPDLPVDDTLGYSGFRLRTELEKEGIYQEFCVFQGASYFRAIGAGLTYGLSARGLAIDTADPDGEEFPDFRHFWIVAPEPGETGITVHALLDGPSVTGAFTFRIEPGEATVMQVEASLYPRRELTHVGLAPLTSMFMFDESNRSHFDDFRAGVHDSDGLLIWNGAGEQLWRPLANPRNLEVSSFVDQNPRGFGLMQRSRDLSKFSDLEAHYHERPSLWIEPRGEWGPGTVRLVEIPTDREIYDNIVAYWRPERPMPAGERVDYAYTMRWSERAEGLPELARVINTRQGLGFDQERRVIAVDFGPHPAFDAGLETLTAFVGADSGSVSPGRLQRNPETGGIRLDFDFDPNESDAREFRAQIRNESGSLSEVWLYRWTAWTET